jgi:hypothetical protein
MTLKETTEYRRVLESLEHTAMKHEVFTRQRFETSAGQPGFTVTQPSFSGKFCFFLGSRPSIRKTPSPTKVVRKRGRRA